MIDWAALEREYICTKTTYKQLSEKYNVSHQLIMKYGASQKWVEKRKKHIRKIEEKTLEKIEDKESDKLAKLADTADKAAERIQAVFDDELQFNRYVNLDIFEEKVLQKVDTKSLKEAVSALKELTGVIRNIYGIQTVGERQAHEIAVERLKLDQAKNSADLDMDKNINIVFESGKGEYYSE